MAETYIYDAADDAGAGAGDAFHRALRRRRAPLESLTAAAVQLSSAKVGRVARPSDVPVSSEPWQEEAWNLFDLVGEQHFLATTLAARIGQARLFVGKRPDDPTEDIAPLEDGPACEVLELLQPNMGDLLTRWGVNLNIAGDCWLVGTPPDGGSEADAEVDGAGAGGGRPGPIPAVPSLDEGVDLSEFEWSARSVTEVNFERDGTVTIKDGRPSSRTGRAGGGVTYALDEVFLVRIWNPHPRLFWQADSATRAVLPILREIVALTMHVGAQVDSRLAGAGMLLYPQESSKPVYEFAGDDGHPVEVSPDAGNDPVMDDLIRAMVEPISDRDSASAIVPLVHRMPAEHIESVRHLSFSQPLDDQAPGMRVEAITRLARSQDCPPELLLGTGGMNHWGAWLVREDTVSTHVEPPLALICDALTREFLWPVLRQQMPADEAESFAVWYSIDHLIMRPNRGSEALELFDRGAISEKTLRSASGFDEEEGPQAEDGPGGGDPAVDRALEMVVSAPSLAQDPGIPALVEQLRAVMGGSGEAGPASASDLSPGADGGGGGVPVADAVTEVGVPSTADDPVPGPLDGGGGLA